MSSGLFLFVILFSVFSSIASESVNDSYALKRLSSKQEEATGGSVWDVVIKTCDDQGAGTDAAAYLKVFYERDHASEIFQLDNPGKNDFERGERSHFKVMLRQDDIVNIGLFWWPGFTLNEEWCVDWALLLNSNRDRCYEGIFHRWILHYKDPPTYAVKFHRLAFADCVNPAPSGAQRFHFLRLLDDSIS